MRQRWLGGLLFLAALPCVASAQVPAGGEFRVSTYTTGRQYTPAVAVDAGGRFVVVWAGDSQDGSGYGVFGQRYDAPGTALGGEFRVNTYTTGLQYVPAVAMDARGRFLVVWTSDFEDGNGRGVFGQRYDGAGTPLGDEFRVNSYTTDTQNTPAVAVDAAGNFIVGWGSDTQDGSGYAVFARRYAAAGAPLGAEFQVNTYTTTQQFGPAVALDAAGNVVVVWESFTQDGSGFGVFGQRYGAAGTPLGGEFRVNTHTTGTQDTPGVAVDPSGRFVVVWRSDGQDGSGSGIYGQRYDAAGTPLAGEFRVNSYTTSHQSKPAVAVDAAGRFVVVWASDGPDGSTLGVFGQRYDASGQPLGSEFQVNTYTTNYQGTPAVAVDAVGNFVVVWASDLQDGSGLGIFGQRYGGLLPAALAVDAAGNAVLEPGETVTVAPSWRNVNGGPLVFAGAASELAGPAGATYTLGDAAASYGTVAAGTTTGCTDCYQVAVSRPATRPAIHWDAAVRETIAPDALGQTTRWALHVGESFTDVPPTNPFYRFIETLLHVGVTAGCGGTAYCPDGSTTREQMAVFLLRAREGAAYAPPPCTTAPFPDVPCGSPFAAWVQELVARGITAGCGGGFYCPTAPVTRAQMAVFLTKTFGLTLYGP